MEGTQGGYETRITYKTNNESQLQINMDGSKENEYIPMDKILMSCFF